MVPRFTAPARDLLITSGLARQFADGRATGPDPPADPLDILRALLAGNIGLAGRILSALGVDRTAALAAIDGALADPPHKPNRNRLIECFIRTAKDLGHDSVGTDHLLLVLLQEHWGAATQALKRLGLDPAGVQRALLDQRGCGIDDDLLFGAVTLRLGLARRADLVATMNACAGFECRPLGLALVESGLLPDSARSPIEHLVSSLKETLPADLFDEARTLLDSYRSSGWLAPPDADFAGGPQSDQSTIDQPDPAGSSTLGSTIDQGRDRRESGLAGSAGRAPSREVVTATHCYRVLRPHGRGGMGVVYIARDEQLGREVALKEMHGTPADPTYLSTRSRFLLEARVVGSLEHPGIAGIYALGEAPDGRPFYAMRLIRGETLKDHIDRFHRVDPPGNDPAEQRLALRRILASFIAACNAMAYAHSRGVIHRDLKPANIMLGAYGETFVIDWGLAKVEGSPIESAMGDDPPRAPRYPDESHATAFGQLLGTPGYMSPEQVLMNRPTRVGTASDVYGLGATLYHILTGQRPLCGSSILQIVQLFVVKGEIPRPRSINASVDPALEAICLKAMAHEPADRYASPRGLAEDIERWLAAESSTTPTRPSWVTRWARARWGIRPRETPDGRQ